MDNQFYFNSIRLNSDIHVAGDFLFEAFLALAEIKEDITSYENKLFGIYYKTAVGIERLQKNIVLLSINASQHTDLPTDKKDVLFRHSHVALGKKIEVENPDIKFSSEERKLLQNLTEYYNNYRYGYYKFGETKKITDIFLEFANIKVEEPIFFTLSLDIKKAADIFIEVLSSLVNKYIQLIINKNTFHATETESYSKFFVVYNYRKDILKFIYLRELAIKEFLAFLSGYTHCIEFEEPADFNDYIRQITFGENCINLIDLVTEYYREHFDIKELDENFIQGRIKELDHYLSSI